jgi:DNA-binding beta-propeller fold protein YncE
VLERVTRWRLTLLHVRICERVGVRLPRATRLDVAASGKIYFSDASVKFGAQEWGSTYEASLLDIMEHGGHGRLLVFDPQAGKATTVLDGLNFPNGVAVSHDQMYVLVNEMGGYRVIRVWVDGPNKGHAESLIEALPVFPDNISTGLDGRFWVALISPRNRLVDNLSGHPFLRMVIQRMPAPLRPKAIAYGHIITINDAGNVIEDLQDPDGGYPINTSVTEIDKYLYVGSLVTLALA